MTQSLICEDRMQENRYDACVACGGSAIRYWRSKSYAYSTKRHTEVFHIDRCGECGTGFLNPPPDDAALASIYEYSGHGLSAPLDAREVIERENRFPNSTLDADRMVRKAMAFSTSSTRNALDVGSGYGFYTKKLQESGYRTTSLNPGKYENRVFKDICGCEPLPVYFQEFSATSQYDIVLMSQVLEHMKTPVEAVRKVSALLSPGGVFACAVPNFRSFSVIVRGTRDNGCLWVPEHVNYFTAAGLRKLVASCGLRVVFSEYITRIPCHRVCERLRLPNRDLLYRALRFGLSRFDRLVDGLGYGICINLYAIKDGG
jgi:2-polyprenyl-3-methyl-5-hydroxy-6-metoxy-1,4-benzoquinol methylase